MGVPDARSVRGSWPLNPDAAISDYSHCLFVFVDAIIHLLLLCENCLKTNPVFFSFEENGDRTGCSECLRFTSFF
ncbi:hypothetical protein AB6A40_009024 [Gnathostoma spinigerum]|uniref:Uncharacterized protein n=1 Tax=Gnathostoma spinigerum TaxID=75299 RepID=A0ABD6ERZ4_9BILA